MGLRRVLLALGRAPAARLGAPPAVAVLAGVLLALGRARLAQVGALTGGYLLTACFASGRVAGQGALDWWSAVRAANPAQADSSL